MPAKAGIQYKQRIPPRRRDAFMHWVPAFAGTTSDAGSKSRGINEYVKHA
jgi:hypothetical protein